MAGRFIVISGLPGSGKSTVGRALAKRLGMEMIDKDEILEALFEERGIGDLAWKKNLSRESDAIFERRAKESGGAMLVSHWHLEGMREDSGTRTGWLLALPGGIVNVQCRCAVEIAARRFFERRRHAGHLDPGSFEEALAKLRETERWGALEIGRRVEVDTSGEVDVEELARLLIPRGPPTV